MRDMVNELKEEGSPKPFYDNLKAIPVDTALLEKLPAKHSHPNDPMKFRAAQSVIDQNMSVFTSWLQKLAKTKAASGEITVNEGKMLRMFFIYLRRSMHIAVCAQAWHMLNSLVKSISDLANNDDKALAVMSESLSTPQAKTNLSGMLGIDASDLEDVTASSVANAFKRLFGKSFAKEVLTEFLAQSAFIRDNLYRLGYV